VIIAIVVPVAVFFIPGYYDAVALFMYASFPYAQIIVATVALFFFWLATKGRGIMDAPNHVLFDDPGLLLGLMGIAGFGVLLCGFPVGFAIENPKSVWSDVVSPLAQLAYAPGLWLAHVVIVILFVIDGPYITASVFSLFVSHPAEESIKRSLPQKRPDYVVEKELAVILSSEDAGEERILDLLDELSPWKKWRWEISHKVQAQKARQLRAVAQAKTEALREDSKLAQSVHEMERSRRAQADHNDDD
jgi:hypothetical protein